MDGQTYSWILTAIGLLGFYLAGKRVWWAWYINILNQAVWFFYALGTRQWGFLVGVVFYTVVFSKNALGWTKDKDELRHHPWEQPKPKKLHPEDTLEQLKSSKYDPNKIYKAQPFPGEELARIKVTPVESIFSDEAEFTLITEGPVSEEARQTLYHDWFEPVEAKEPDLKELAKLWTAANPSYRHKHHYRIMENHPESDYYVFQCWTDWCENREMVKKQDFWAQDILIKRADQVAHKERDPQG